jgi:hypothetical protein
MVVPLFRLPLGFLAFISSSSATLLQLFIIQLIRSNFSTSIGNIFSVRDDHPAKPTTDKLNDKMTAISLVTTDFHLRRLEAVSEMLLLPSSYL